MHASVTVSFIVWPGAFVVISTCICHFSLAPFHASLPVSFVDGTVVVCQHSFTVPHAIFPLAVIFNTFLLVDVLSCSMPEAVHYLSFIGWAIWPLVLSRTSDFVGCKLASVDSAICPLERSFSVQKPMLELSFIGMSIPKLARSLTVVDFADLKQLLFEQFLTWPFFS